MNVDDCGGLHIAQPDATSVSTIRELEPAYRFPLHRTTTGADTVPSSSTVMAGDELVWRASTFDSIIPAPSFSDAPPPPATRFPNVVLPPPRPTVRQQRVAREERAERTCGHRRIIPNEQAGIARRERAGSCSAGAANGISGWTEITASALGRRQEEVSTFRLE